MSPLALLKEGEAAEIISVAGPRRSLLEGCRRREHLSDLGFRPGQRVEMVSNRGRGPLVVRLEEARIALGRGIAMKIYVRRKEP
ncbi:MAG: ferrous iron transport protein A [Syntrophaceae bacterium]|nr:ferrous iron transport protein A [Syntrophaceae bacterium]